MKKILLMRCLTLKILLVLVSLFSQVATSYRASYAAGSLIVDHNCTDLAQIPESWLVQVRQRIKVYFGHTSHGMQITEGLKRIASSYGSNYAVAIPGWHLPNVSGALCIYDRTDTYDPGDFFPTVPDVLSPNPEINVVMYAWCGQPGGANWQALLDNYISTVQSLEQRYPNVTFVYMTGNAQENDCSGCARHLFNEQLRQFARNNNKVLFDFADLDVWYNNNLSTYLCPSWCACAGQNIPREHPYWGGGDYNNPCGHTTYESCDNKGKAAWWLLATIAGWNPASAGPSLPPPPPSNLRIIDTR